MDQAASAFARPTPAVVELGDTPEPGEAMDFSREWQRIADDICAKVFPDKDATAIKILFRRYQFEFSRNHDFWFETPIEVVRSLIR